jgi:hypothetical protein
MEEKNKTLLEIRSMIQFGRKKKIVYSQIRKIYLSQKYIQNTRSIIYQVFLVKNIFFFFSFSVADYEEHMGQRPQTFLPNALIGFPRVQIVRLYPKRQRANSMKKKTKIERRIFRSHCGKSEKKLQRSRSFSSFFFFFFSSNNTSIYLAQIRTIKLQNFFSFFLVDFSSSRKKKKR